jgi:hypothetical protein
MKYLFPLVILMLTGCGGIETPRLEIAGFESYVAKFEQYAEAAGRPIKILSLKIKLADIPPPAPIAYCANANSDIPVITLDRNYWNTAIEADKEPIILHELGHCILKRGHVNYRSIMEPSSPSGFVYLPNKDYYLKELFSN